MSAEFSSSVSSLGKPLPSAETIKRRVRIQSALTVICAVGILGASGYRALRPGKPSAPLSAQTLAGIWELQSLDGQPVGEKSQNGIVSQHVVLRDGQISGETRLKPTTEIALPFPDESVAKVETASNGETIVRWNGTYELVDGKRIALHLGKATFFIPAQRDPKSLLLTCENDLILTPHGVALYRPKSAGE